MRCNEEGARQGWESHWESLSQPSLKRRPRSEAVASESLLYLVIDWGQPTGSMTLAQT